MVDLQDLRVVSADMTMNNADITMSNADMITMNFGCNDKLEKIVRTT